MQKLRIVAVGATLTSALCAFAAVFAHLRGWNVERQVFVVMAISAGFSVLPIYCSALAVNALRETTNEVCDRVSSETRALHRSMVVTMEQYGDHRAVDAIVAAERRHTINERGETTDVVHYVGRVNSGNVTPIRKH